VGAVALQGRGGLGAVQGKLTHVPPLEIYGSYQLVEKLAVGGMAHLFLARRLKPRGHERTVVLKRILPHLAEDAAFVTMFLDEARIAARLHHPNVVEILDLGAEGDSYFIAMEYIHGEDLRRIGKRGIELQRRMPPPLVCRVVAQACRGLDYAHRRTDAQGKPLRIVHRDVSPQNILVGFDGQVKVVDFGIAKAVDKATVTASGVIKGKHAYMSPEQALGREIDHRTDVFALGIVLYETLTATRLFRRATDLQTLKAVSECKVEPPSRVFPGVPAGLDSIVLKALSKDLSVRYQRAEELANALEVWLGDRPDGTAGALGRYLTELFADRLEKEHREGKFVPSKSAVDFGVPSRDPSSKLGATALLRVDKRTVTDHQEPPEPQPPPGSSPLESRATDLTPVYEPPERATDGITEPVPIPRVARREGPSSKPYLQGVADPLPVEPPTLQAGERPSALVERGGTTAYGQPLHGGTAVYGRLERPNDDPLAQKTALDPLRQKTLLEPLPKGAYSDLPRVATPMVPLEPPPPPAPKDRQVTAVPRSPNEEDTFKGPPPRPAGLGRWVLSAGAGALLLSAVVISAAVLTLKRRPPPKPDPVAAAVVQPAPPPLTSSTPDAATVTDVGATTAAPLLRSSPMKPFNRVAVTRPAYALTRRGDRLFASMSGQSFELGAALRVVGPFVGGTNERDFYGVASVVELMDGEARVLFEEPQALPDGLFVTAEEDKLEGPYATSMPAGRGARAALLGSVQLRAAEAGSDVAVKNATDFDWSACELRLPDNRFIKLSAAVVVRAGTTQWIAGSSFKFRSSPAELKQRDGLALVRCMEGEGWFKVVQLP
jgi:serine/threonine protein kinase